MKDSTLNQERMWERGWDGHELAQLRRMASLPFSEKLEWLEQAHEFVLRIQQGPSLARSEARTITTGSPDDSPSDEFNEQSARRPQSEAR
jgi:hypothetical protein